MDEWIRHGEENLWKAHALGQQNTFGYIIELEDALASTRSKTWQPSGK